MPRFEMPSIPVLGWWLLGAAAALLVGALGPWADVASQGSVHGTHNEGWVTIVAALLTVVFVVAASRAGWRSRRPAVLIAWLAALSLLVTGLDVSDVADFAGPTGIASIVDPGWGLYLALIGAIVLLAAALAGVAAPPGRRRLPLHWDDEREALRWDDDREDDLRPGALRGPEPAT